MPTEDQPPLRTQRSERNAWIVVVVAAAVALSASIALIAAGSRESSTSADVPFGPTTISSEVLNRRSADWGTESNADCNAADHG